MTRDADRRESATEEEPVKVAIVGGGCGGISAAFELTRKEHRGRFEVTVYQVGWRLGGKGASGRGPDDRIEEHGLHIWLGFYENAFRLMRECYEELDRPRTSRIIDWRDAFFPDPRVGVAEKLRGGEWQQYLAHFPPASGEPGDPDRAHEPITLVDYLVRAASLLTTLVFAVQNRELRTEGRWDRAAGGPSGPRHRAEPPDDGSEPIMSTVARLLKTGPILTAAALIESVRLLETLLGSPENYSSTASLRFIDRIASGAQRIVELTVGDDPEL